MEESSNKRVLSTDSKGINFKHPLDVFPIHFKATSENKWMRVALNIICYIYAINIIFVVISLMNNANVDLEGLPKFHFPVLEHNWHFLMRTIFTRVLTSTTILMAVILFLSIFSYKDIIVDKYKVKLEGISISNKITLFFEHFIETVFINFMNLVKYVVVAILIGLCLGWAIQICLT